MTLSAGYIVTPGVLVFMNESFESIHSKTLIHESTYWPIYVMTMYVCIFEDAVIHIETRHFTTKNTQDLVFHIWTVVAGT